MTVTTTPSIITLTLNPSIDISTVTDKVTTEHKLRCDETRQDPGGGGINVARVLARMGANCSAVYAAGGVRGKLLQQLIANEGVSGHAVEIAGETRESFTVTERRSGGEYRFVLAGPELAPGEWQACIDLIASLPQAPAYIVASGSLPAGVPHDFYARLARSARQRGSRIVVDASGPALAGALKEGVFLVKPNLRELREYTGEALEHEDDWKRAALSLIEAGSAQVVALSLGHRGALLVAKNLMLRAPALEVKIASTVGAGDSFVASMGWRIASGASLEEAFRFGIAGGTAALLASGTSLAHKEDVERLALMVKPVVTTIAGGTGGDGARG